MPESTHAPRPATGRARHDVRVAARLPAVLADELREAARRSDRSLSAELRRAVTRHLERERPSALHS